LLLFPGKVSMGLDSRLLKNIVLAATMALFPGTYSSTYAADGRATSVEPRLLREFEPRFRASVLRGWRSFQTSFAGDGLACVHCHLDHGTMRHWAGAYPKVEVFDGTPYRVKGLRQVVLEALEKHTDLSPEQRAALAEDLVAYIAWWGDGGLVTPGRSRASPPAAEDLARLRASVERGSGLFQRRDLGPCGRCHHSGEKASTPDKTPVGGAAATFPRYVKFAGRVMSLEAFLSWHLADIGKKEYSPESSVVTDLAAYLVSLAGGKRFLPGGGRNGAGDQHDE